MKNFRQQPKRPKKNTLVVGRDAVEKALQSGDYLDKILLQTNIQGEQIENIKKLAAEAGVPVTRVPVEKLNFLNVYNHEGCIAHKARIAYKQLQDVISFFTESGEVPMFIILDGVTDIRNIGAIARSAYALGAQAIIIPEKGVGALNEDAILTSAGALEQISVCRVNNLVQAIEDLHLNGIQVFATEMKSKKNLYEADLTIPLAMILGGEEMGIQPAVRKMCDEELQIPMPGNFESLNVSVAGGIFLYETVRQRLQSK